jgi:hypothetical protein
MTTSCSKPPSEAEIQQAIRLALGMEPGLVLWRNQVGMATHVASNGAMSRAVPYGVGGKGGSDLVGILTMHVSTTCDPNDTETHYPCLGHEREVGRFVALEIKRPGGKPTKEQIEFIALVRSLGGFACVVTSVEEAHAAIERARHGENQ